MKKFQNSKKSSFLESIPTASLDQENNNITSKMKFNFSYFDSTQSTGYDITKLNEDSSNKFIRKIIEFSRESINYWSNFKTGSGKHRNSIYINYGDFPRKSNFFHPKNVPHQVYWGRFRLELDLRLIGFVVPDDYHGKTNIKTGMTYDKNTFYVVFLDPEHNFYITKK